MSPRTPISSPGRADEREKSWPWLREAPVEHGGRVVEHAKGGCRLLGKVLPDQAANDIVHGRLSRTKLVETAPGLGDDLGRPP